MINKSVDNLLNKLPQVIENRNNNRLLEPIIYPTAWGKWCIAYKEIAFDMSKKPTKVFSVVVEPDRDPVRIEDTIGSMNEYIGNAPTFEEAITMIVDYIDKTYETTT
jgi:hypothetical protein